MAITREKKEAIVDEYAELLHRSQAVIVTEYRGLTVKQLEGLRRDLRGCRERADGVQEHPHGDRPDARSACPRPSRCLTGPTAVTFCYDEVAAPAKMLTKFAKDSKILVVRGALMGQIVFDEAGVQALSELPSKDQLRAQVVGTLQSPISGLVNVLAGPVRGFMNVLNARMAQLEQPSA